MWGKCTPVGTPYPADTVTVAPKPNLVNRRQAATLVMLSQNETRFAGVNTRAIQTYRFNEESLVRSKIVRTLPPVSSIV